MVAPGFASSQAPASPRYQDLLRKLKLADDLAYGLITDDLNIAGLLPCDAAAATLGNETRCTGDHVAGLALQLTDELHRMEDPVVRLAKRVTTTRKPTGGAREHWNILAVRFHPGESGWLFWFRHAQVDAGHCNAWEESDVELAQRLRVDLMEICLERAGRYKQSQTQLLRKLAHDLANPLQSISMSTPLLQAEGKRNLDISRHISTAADKLRTIAISLQELGRLETAGPAVLNPTRTDLSALVSEMLESLPEVSCQVDIEPATHIRADQGRVQRLLSVLLDNAQRYRQPDTPLRVTLHRTGNAAHLCVANQAETPNRAPSTGSSSAVTPDRTQLPYTSQGMGLRLATAIARAHGGALGASTGDGWVRFTLTLPLEC